VGLASAEVSGDPKKTAENAEQIHRTALAQANPSAQDRAVAAQAAATATKARAEIALVQRREAAEARPTAQKASESADQPASVIEDTERVDASRQHQIAVYESVASIDENVDAHSEANEQRLSAVRN
jgi:hypothetical protein